MTREESSVSDAENEHRTGCDTHRYHTSVGRDGRFSLFSSAHSKAVPQEGSCNPSVFVHFILTLSLLRHRGRYNCSLLRARRFLALLHRHSSNQVRVTFRVLYILRGFQGAMLSGIMSLRFQLYQ
jgi:hypothetical protein